MKKNYETPSVQWVTFQVADELMGPSGNPSVGDSTLPFSLRRDEGYTAADGDYMAE